MQFNYHLPQHCTASSHAHRVPLLQSKSQSQYSLSIWPGQRTLAGNPAADEVVTVVAVMGFAGMDAFTYGVIGSA